MGELRSSAPGSSLCSGCRAPALVKHDLKKKIYKRKKKEPQSSVLGAKGVYSAAQLLARDEGKATGTGREQDGLYRMHQPGTGQQRPEAQRSSDRRARRWVSG